MKKTALYNQPPDGVFELHTVPLNDLRFHIVGPDCWCYPTLREPRRWAHNAKDCREAYERHTGECRSPDHIWAVVAARPRIEPDEPVAAPLKIRRIGRWGIALRWNVRGHWTKDWRGADTHLWALVGPTEVVGVAKTYNLIIGPLGVAFGRYPKPCEDQPN